MFQNRDPAKEIVNESNRPFAVESGPVQPVLDYPKSVIGGRNFRFQQKWYEEFKWLEYSISKDVAFCFNCRCFGSLGMYETLLHRFSF